MKNRIKKVFYLLVSVFMLAALLAPLAGCASGGSPETGTAALTIVKGDQTITYTLDALKKLPSVSGWAGQMSSTGNITGPLQYKGVAMSELLKAVGGVSESDAVRVSAKDGYAMTLSYSQLTKGNFTVIDSATGKETTAANQPQVFVAYEEDGKPIDEAIGPLRLGILTSEKQVTDGHWWVKWAQKIEVVAGAKPWNLKLEGAVTYDVDPGTFESGAAIGCHGAKWTDDQGRVWEGIPLWYLVGRVDDTNTHQGDAYNDALADAGYEIQLTAADGFTLKLTSQEVKRNDTLIVAYKRDGGPLPDNQWPLRLVGQTLTKDKMIGQITSIKLNFGATAPTTTPAPTSTPAPAGPTVMTVISGSQTKTFSLDQLKAMTPLTGYGGTKNKAGVVTGPLPYKGVALMDLLNAVGGITAANAVKFTAKDGYTKTLTYDQITKGTFTTYDATGTAANAEMQPVVFLAYEADGKALDDTTGPLQLAVMTCKNQVTDGSNFVKMVEKIEIVPAG